LSHHLKEHGADQQHDRQKDDKRDNAWHAKDSSAPKNERLPEWTTISRTTARSRLRERLILPKSFRFRIANLAAYRADGDGEPPCLAGLTGISPWSAEHFALPVTNGNRIWEHDVSWSVAGRRRWLSCILEGAIGKIAEQGAQVNLFR
jgi:hypothetical protein